MEKTIKLLLLSIGFGLAIDLAELFANVPIIFNVINLAIAAYAVFVAAKALRKE